MKLKWQWKSLVLVAATVMCVGCGGDNESSNPVPTAPPPVSDIPLIPPTTPEPDPVLGACALETTVPLKLTDSKNFQGLQDLLQSEDPPLIFVPPLVGDVRFAVDLPAGREQHISATVRLGFEDREGHWCAEQKSFDGTGYRSANWIDIVFQDDRFALRVLGTVSGDDITGEVYYRIRQWGDTACRYYSYFMPPDSVDRCRAYTDRGNGSVKLLGTFKAKYSNWVAR